MSSPAHSKSPITITAVIPAWNAGRFIARTLQSVINQTRPADEIIVVDDGSTDNTAEVVQSFGSQVRYLHQANAGASAARNAGIKAASSQWIAFLDGDDEWLPDTLAQHESAIRNRPDLVWFMANYLLCSCNENYRALGHDPAHVDKLLHGQTSFPSYFFACSHQVFSWTGTFIIRRDILEEVGMFKVGLPRYNDIELWFRIAYRYPEIGFINHPLGIYHLDVAQSITRKYQNQTIFYDFLDHHIELAISCHQLDQLAPCVRYLLTSRMRGMIFQGDKTNIRHILHKYRPYLTGRFARLAWILTIYPPLTLLGCRILSWINRTFKFRKQIVRQDNPDTVNPESCGSLNQLPDQKSDKP